MEGEGKRPTCEGAASAGCRCRYRTPACCPALPCRVEAVQQTLGDLTGIPPADQILMCEGARLDAAKPLSAYGLPGVRHFAPPMSHTPTTGAPTMWATLLPALPA